MSHREPNVIFSCASPVARLLAGVLAAVGMADAQELEIHRCIQDDGTVAFQEMPCPAESSEEGPVGEDAVDDDIDDSYVLEMAVVPAGNPPSGDRAACEKAARDAIDAIDLEMRKGFSEEEGEAYLATLLELTQQLRACKSL